MYYNPPALKHLVFFIMGVYRHELYFIRGVATIFQRGSHCIKQRVLIRFSCRSPRLVLHKIEKGLQERGGGGHATPRPHPP